MRHQVEKGTFSYENKERTKREKLVRTKWAFHRFGALTVYVPFLDRTKKIKSRYLVSDASDKTQMVKRVTDIISTQNEVLNFPKQ